MSGSLESILDGITDPFLVVDRELRCTFLNLAAAKMAGRDREALIGQSVWDAMPGGGERWQGALRRAMSRWRPVRVCEFHETSGKWLEATLYPAADGACVYTRDVTRPYRAAREWKKRYLSLFHSIGDGFCIVKILLDETGRPIDYLFIETNRAFHEHTGLEAGAGRRARELIPNLEDCWVEALGKVALESKPVHFEAEAKPLHRWFAVYAFPFGTRASRNVAVLFNNITERKSSEAFLVQHHDELEKGVFERTRDLSRLNEELSAEIGQRKSTEKALLDRMEQLNLVERQRKQLLRKIVTTQEEERRRIARELHDQLGQQLSALTVKLASLGAQCGAQEALRQEARSLESMVQQIDKDVESLVWQLRLTALDDLGLPAALDNYIREWSKNFEIQAELHVGGMVKSSLPSEVETMLYRVAQEALNNIAKHSKARHVAVLLQRDAARVSLIIEDDGVGFDPQQAFAAGGTGAGLIGIRERTELLSGTLAIESHPGGGATIVVGVPV